MLRKEFQAALNTLCYLHSANKRLLSFVKCAEKESSKETAFEYPII